MKNFFFKFWPVIVIFLIWFIFAKPYFLESKTPFPAKYQINNFAPWSANNKFWGPVKNAAMPDIITQIYPWKFLVIESWKDGVVPLWNFYSFSGNPLLANYQSAALTPFNLLFFVLPFIDAWSVLVLLQPLLAGFFMYMFTRSLKISKEGSLVSSISFMFCGFMTSWMGYATLGYAILYLPLALYSIEKYWQKNNKYYLVLFSITLPLSFFSGHFQISLYFLIGIFSYLIYKLIVTKSFIIFFRLILFTFFGLLLIMPQILPSLELYYDSFRSSFYQGGGIIIGYLPTLIAPDFFGNPVTGNTWFGHYAEWNAYVGLLPLMLAIYSILKTKNNRTLFFIILGILPFILAINSPLSQLIQNMHIPVFSTSSINRIIVLYCFSFAVLAGFGLDLLAIDIKNNNKKIIILWLCLIALLFLLLWGAIIFKILIPLDKAIISRQNLILPTIIFFGSIILALASLIFKKIKKILIFGLIAITIFDLMRFSIKWQTFDSKSLAFPSFSTTKAFSKIYGIERSLGNFGSESTIYYKLPSVEGYDALYSKRYGQFMGYIEKKNFLQSSWSVVELPKKSENTKKTINLLNIKYVIHKLADDGAPWTFPVWNYPGKQFSLIYKDKYYAFYKNNSVYPRAFLVNRYKIIKDDEKILKALFSDNFDFKNEVILEKEPKIIMKTSNNVGNVTIKNYKSNLLELLVSAKENSLLFVSDNYNSGWKASIDGKKVEIFRADYAFRAVSVNSGEHRVRFWYDPWSFKLGLYLAVFGVLGITLFTTFFSISKNRDL